MPASEINRAVLAMPDESSREDRALPGTPGELGGELALVAVEVVDDVRVAASAAEADALAHAGRIALQPGPRRNHSPCRTIRGPQPPPTLRTVLPAGPRPA